MFLAMDEDDDELRQMALVIAVHSVTQKLKQQQKKKTPRDALNSATDQELEQALEQLQALEQERQAAPT